MVPSYQCDAIWIANFQAQKQQEGLERVEAAVHKVAHEEVVRLRYIASNPKKFHQIVELAVDVTAYLVAIVSPIRGSSESRTAYRDWRIYSNHVALFYEQLACLVT